MNTTKAAIKGRDEQIQIRLTQLHTPTALREKKEHILCDYTSASPLLTQKDDEIHNKAKCDPGSREGVANRSRPRDGPDVEKCSVIISSKH